MPPTINHMNTKPSPTTLARDRGRLVVDEANSCGRGALTPRGLASSGVGAPRPQQNSQASDLLVIAVCEVSSFQAETLQYLHPTATLWTIKLRPNILFSDGSKLDAQVVKDNLDAYRGKYPGRAPLLY